ncbi:MAG: MoaD family protein [Phycisphaeraceae bacterium]|nr:MoaD family protein [Phycisphaeraceae bacterium]
MSITIQIPAALRPQADGQASLQLEGGTVREALGELKSRYPELGGRLFKSDNEVNRFINFYLNDEDIRFLDSLETKLKSGDELAIVPAIAGG